MNREAEYASNMEPAHVVLSLAERGEEKALSELLLAGRTDVVDEEGSTPLMYAAANGRESVVLKLASVREHVHVASKCIRPSVCTRSNS